MKGACGSLRGIASSISSVALGSGVVGVGPACSLTVSDKYLLRGVSIRRCRGFLLLRGRSSMSCSILRNCSICASRGSCNPGGGGAVGCALLHASANSSLEEVLFLEGGPESFDFAVLQPDEGVVLFDEESGRLPVCVVSEPELFGTGTSPGSISPLEEGVDGTGRFLPLEEAGDELLDLLGVLFPEETTGSLGVTEGVLSCGSSLCSRGGRDLGVRLPDVTSGSSSSPSSSIG